MNALLLFSLFGPGSLLTADPAMRDHLVLFGALFLAVFTVATGLLLVRALKHRRSQRHGRSRHRHSSRRTAGEMAGLKKMMSERSQHRRRVHRSRKPTLAEAGGLPPMRSDEPLIPSQPRSQPH
jgi:type VI protein secretion system component VasK